MQAVSRNRHTPQGTLFTSLILEVFRLNGALMAAGNRLGRDASLTSARWQVLGAIALRGPLTVAEIARFMGMTRQGAQRLADDLEANHLIERGPHPEHRRARLVRLSEAGRAAYNKTMARQIPWANRCAEGLSLPSLKTAIDILTTTRQEIEERNRDLERRKRK